MIAWIPVLGRHGLVNKGLLALGLVDEPVEWLLFSDFSVVLAFVHLYTLFMVVPIFNSMMRIDPSVIEAAYDAGAGAWRVAHRLTWTLPFGLLIMFAVFNRFDPSYEEAARDLGARPWQVFRYVVLPLIGPSLVGVGLFGFTLSFDEFARTLLAAGVHNTLPLEIFGMTTNATTPVLYALGTVTTGVSFLVILLSLVFITLLRRRRMRHGTDAGAGMV